MGSLVAACAMHDPAKVPQGWPGTASSKDLAAESRPTVMMRRTVTAAVGWDVM